MHKNIYCTIDTETVGGAISPTGMYNLGAIIHDKDGNILATTSFLVMEHYDEISKDSYAKKNFPLYQKRLCEGSLSAVASENEAITILSNLCHFYNVKYVMAFNSGFDFTKTICRQLLEEFEFIDLYLMALQTITHLKKYATFCQEHNKLSKSKCTYSTSAETIYSFITNQPDYQEEHTALSDAKIEMTIFVRCYSMHKKFTRNIHQHDYKGKDKIFPKKSLTNPA